MGFGIRTLKQLFHHFLVSSKLAARVHIAEVLENWKPIWTKDPAPLDDPGQIALIHWSSISLGLPRQHSSKGPPWNAGDVGLIPGSGRSPEGGNGNPLQYSCLENPMDRGAWQATVHAVAKSQTEHIRGFPIWKWEYSCLHFHGDCEV